MKLLVNKTKIISIITFVICFLGFIFSYEEINGTQSEIYVFSVIGVIELLFCLITLRNVTGRNFSLYGIFIIFAFLFHYGQCLMWAFGIHYPNEIGTANIYTKGIPSGEIIAKSQLLTLIGLLSFHTGALLVMKKAKGTKRQEKFDINIIRTNRKAQALYTASVIALAISLPLMYLYQIRDITVNARYGYGAILYNEIVVASQNNTIQLLRQMYFPAIVGLLISTGYRKKTVYFCYFNFAIFVLLNLMAGNRGEWIYPLAILIWMHHSFVKKINVKKLVVYVLIGIIVVSISVGIRNIRNNGINIQSLLNAMLIEDNPIVSAIFEMGGSMRPTILITESGWGIYPYGNTYILALLGMVTERVVKVFIPDYVSVSYWFSHYFLRLNFGIGFSLVAEAFINFGPYLSMFFLFGLGIIYSFLISSEQIDINKEPIKMFLKICVLNALILSVRNYILGSLKHFIFSSFSIYLVTLIILSVYKRTKPKRNKSNIYQVDSVED